MSCCLFPSLFISLVACGLICQCFSQCVTKSLRHPSLIFSNVYQIKKLSVFPFLKICLLQPSFLLCFLKIDSFVHLKGRMTENKRERERERDTERSLSSSGSLSKCLQQSRFGQAKTKTLELHPGLSHKW